MVSDQKQHIAIPPDDVTSDSKQKGIKRKLAAPSEDPAAPLSSRARTTTSSEGRQVFAVATNDTPPLVPTVTQSQHSSSQETTGSLSTNALSSDYEDPRKVSAAAAAAAAGSSSASSALPPFTAQEIKYYAKIQKCAKANANDSPDVALLREILHQRHELQRRLRLCRSIVQARLNDVYNTTPADVLSTKGRSVAGENECAAFAKRSKDALATSAPARKTSSVSSSIKEPRKRRGQSTKYNDNFVTDMYESQHASTIANKHAHPSSSSSSAVNGGGTRHPLHAPRQKNVATKTPPANIHRNNSIQHNKEISNNIRNSNNHRNNASAVSQSSSNNTNLTKSTTKRLSEGKVLRLNHRAPQSSSSMKSSFSQKNQLHPKPQHSTNSNVKLSAAAPTSNTSSAASTTAMYTKEFLSLCQKYTVTSVRLRQIPSAANNSDKLLHRLPQRRKTQWDYVLAEMRHMATDFHQERMWKIHSARRTAMEVAIVRRDANVCSDIDEMNVDYEKGRCTIAIGNGKDDESDEGVARRVAHRVNSMIRQYWNAYRPPPTIPATVTQIRAATENGANVALADAKSDASHHVATKEGVDSTIRTHTKVSNTAQDAPTTHDLSPSNETHFPSSYTEKEEELCKLYSTLHQKHLKSRKAEITKFQNYFNRASDYSKPVPPSYILNQCRFLDAFFTKSPSTGAGILVDDLRTATAMLWRFNPIGPILVLCEARALMKWRCILRRKLTSVTLYEMDVRRQQLRKDKASSKNIVGGVEEDAFGERDVLLMEFDVFIHCINRDNSILSSTQFCMSVVDATCSPTSDSFPDRFYDMVLYRIKYLEDKVQRILIHDCDLKDRLVCKGYSVSWLRRWCVPNYSRKTDAIDEDHCTADGSEEKKYKHLFGLFVDEQDKSNSDLNANAQINCNELVRLLDRRSKRKWEYILCPSPSKQTDFYRTVCNWIRGALASTQWLLPRSVASALHRLRGLCFHHDASGLLRDGRHIETEVWLKKALDGSGKLQALIGLLYAYKVLEESKCPQHVRDLCTRGPDNLLPTALDKDTDESGNRGESNSYLVILLASLPEAQLSTHLLLHKLGVRHDIILPQHFPNNSSSTNPMEQKQVLRDQQAMAWATIQQQLTAFISNHCMSSSFENPMLIVPPDMLDPSHNGIDLNTIFGHCISSQALVVSLDEDWSGRNDGLYNRIISSCPSCNHVRFMKFLCQDSVESSVIYRDDEERGESAGFDSIGYRVLKHAGSPLREILHCPDMLVDINTKQPPVFLPQLAQSEGDTKADLIVQLQHSLQSSEISRCYISPPVQNEFPRSLLSRDPRWLLSWKLRNKRNAEISLNESEDDPNLGASLKFSSESHYKSNSLQISLTYHPQRSEAALHLDSSVMEPLVHSGIWSGCTSSSQARLKMTSIETCQERYLCTSGIELHSWLMYSPPTQQSKPPIGQSASGLALMKKLIPNINHEMARVDMIRQQSDLVWSAVLQRIESSKSSPTISLQDQSSGISLPMGVRVRHVENVDSLKQFWRVNDSKLQHFYRKFGPNWHLLATSLNDQGIVSARQCKVRYTALSKEKPRENSDLGNPLTISPSPTTKSRLLQLRQSATHVLPAPTMPSSATVVAAHNSHELSVQTAVNSYVPANATNAERTRATNGELWPLQLLDLSDHSRTSNSAS